MDQAMIYALTVVAGGLLPAGEVNIGQAQRQANARANVESLEGSELLRQNLNTQMTNAGELRPAIFTGHVLSAERDGGVLYAPAQPDNPTFRAEVSAIIGMPCDYFDARADTPTVELMNDYDAVFTWVNDACADNELFGDRLADYVDGGGKVILGQSTLPTQGNYLSGEIMTEAHCPATAGSYTYSGTYQGAGVQCEHVLGPVVAYDTQYRDLASAISGATSDGTFDDGLPAVIWRSDRGVHYSAGNLGGQYSTGDWAQLTANMVICTDARLVGACCDPYTGICTDDVEVMECLPPLEFHLQETCADLDPPCGNPGACCEDISGDCVDGEFELNCDGTRFAAGALCDDFDPPCGEMLGACCCGATPEPGVCEAWECIGDMTNGDCLAAGEQTFWTGDESCDAAPPYDCGAPTYCDGSGGAMDKHIINVYMPHDAGTIDNDSGQEYYGDYTDIVAYVTPCLSYELTVTNAEYWSTDITTVWIDWNGDKDCYDEGEQIWSYDPGGAVASGTISVPPTAIAGYTRMRIRIQYGGTPDPCGSTTYGEVEDYTVLVSGEMPIGACCDPYTADCIDDVSGADCLPPFQFAYGEQCADLIPPCGNPGACCDDDTATCTTEFELNCTGRFAAGAPCDPDPFSPPCGEWVPVGMLYCPSQPDDPGFRADVEAFIGKTVDYFDARVATPTLELLMEYVSVFTWVNYPYADNVAMGDVLADYVDAGGIVILGQWCLPTAGNYLSGRIMTEGYCPATASFYSSDSYAGDGFMCPTMGVDSFSSSYFDQVTAAEGAWSDGTTCNGYDFVCFRLSMNVWYSPGNTGSGYTSGDVVELTANMYACGTYWRTACCHPTEYDPATGAGVCENHVHFMDCMPPLEFHSDQTCASLHPPCGNPGACCDDALGQCSIELELNCDGTRFAAGALCDDFDPPCGEMLGACCCGPEGEEGICEPYECIADMTVSDCLAAGEQTFWAEGESCEGPVPYGCGAPGLLYAPTQPDNPEFRADVEALTGRAVDYFDPRDATPTLELLMEYSSVFTWVNYAYADSDAMGDVLADYVDVGGRVILGQWCLPTAGNYLSGRIMTEGYNPATGSVYSSDSYAGDGFMCPTLDVDSFSSSYFDQVTAAEGAFSDGTTANGNDFVCHWLPMNVWYSAGNTGSDYTSGDVVQLTANTVLCDPEPMYGACCHPTEYGVPPGVPGFSGLCEDDVELQDCLLPLHFRWEQTCAGLDPPCGDPGCCCYPEDGETFDTYEELAALCPGRHVSEVLGDDCTVYAFEPPCGWPCAFCTHAITMWDDWGDGWNGGYIDVYRNGELIFGGLTLPSGSGPGYAYFEVQTCDTIETVWTPGGWPYECNYCISGPLGDICCDGQSGVAPTGVTCNAMCELPKGACCLGFDGCEDMTEAACGGTFLGDCTDCGDMADCDSDGMTDLCAIAVDEAEDCNENGIPDECDIAAGTSADDNGDGIPDECTVVSPLDIKPGSCPNPLNRGSHGVLPVALVGREDFDVTGIDISSVRLWRADGVGGEVAPHEGPPGPHSVFEDVATPFEGEPCDCHQLAGDGIVDLSMKFKTDDVVEALLLDDLPAGALVELVVSGYLLEGTPFEASDCIRLVPPGTSSGMLSVESNVAGAWIDVSPPDETLDGGGLADFERSFPLTTVVTLTAEPEAQG